MRVALIINQMHLGGAERVVAQLALAGQAHGVDVHVHTVRGPGALGQSLREQGIAVRDWGLARGIRRPLHLTTLALRLGSMLARDAVDVVHGHLCEGNLVARLAGRRAHLPVVCSLHTTHLLQPYEGWIERGSAQLVDTHVAVSHAIRDLAVAQLGLHPAPQVIANGCRVDDSAVPPRHLKVLGFAGRLHRDKGLDVLLQALADPRLASVRLRVAGDGPEDRQLRDLARRLGLSPRVDFLSSVDDMPRFYRSVDAVVVPSRHEGLSMVALESMAHARPVIASRVGGNPELIEHDRCGWLVAPEDAAGLSQQLAACTQLPSLSPVAAAARQRIRAHYSEQRMIDAHVRLWAALYARRRRLPPPARAC